MTRFLVARSRIQRNWRPNYAYVDHATLRPLDNPNLSRAHAPPLQNINVVRAHAPQPIFLKEDIVPENLHCVLTIELLRCRARTVLAHYKRMWEVVSNQKPVPFVWQTPERGNHDLRTSRNILRKYIADQMPGEVSPSANTSVAPVGVTLPPVLATVTRNTDNGAQVHGSSGVVTGAGQGLAQTDNPSVGPNRQRYSQQYAVDVQRIERQMEMEDIGLSKPNVNRRSPPP